MFRHRRTAEASALVADASVGCLQAVVPLDVEASVRVAPALVRGYPVLVPAPVLGGVNAGAVRPVAEHPTELARPDTVAFLVVVAAPFHVHGGGVASVVGRLIADHTASLWMVIAHPVQVVGAPSVVA